MKKFITGISLQPEGQLKKNIYEAVDNHKLQYDKEISFPVLAIMNGYVEKGEEVKLLVIKQKHEYADANYKIFQQEVKVFEEEKGCKCEIVLVEPEYDDSTTEQLHTFSELIGHIEDEDELYACMTYGSKPMPVMEMMVLNYAYRARKQTMVGCIAYGQRDFAENKMKIYDMTNLFMVDEIVRKVADMKLEDPLKFIRTVLD